MKRYKNSFKKFSFVLRSLTNPFSESVCYFGKWRHLLLIAVSLISFSHLDAQNFRNLNRTPTPNDNLVSFKVNDDGSATFRLYAPNAKKVELGGMIYIISHKRFSNKIRMNH